MAKARFAVTGDQISEVTTGSGWTGATLTVLESDGTSTTFKSMEPADIDELQARLDSPDHPKGPARVVARPAAPEAGSVPEVQHSGSPSSSRSGDPANREPFPLAVRIALAVVAIAVVNLVVLNGSYDAVDITYRVAASIVVGRLALMPKAVSSATWNWLRSGISARQTPSQLRSTLSAAASIGANRLDLWRTLRPPSWRGSPSPGQHEEAE